MDYRFYIFDGAHIVRGIDLEAADDSDAIVLAEAECRSDGCRRCELWRRSRMVTTMDAHSLRGGR